MLSREEIREFAGGESGLSTPQVQASREKYGANVMTPPPREPAWKQYLENFNDPIIRILIFAVAISAIVSLLEGSGLLDTIGIIVAILLATGISFYNEYRSSREFDVLNAHRDEMAVKVIRDGNPAAVPAKDLVVGDLVLLEAGDAIPADGWLVSADGLFCDESCVYRGERTCRKKYREKGSQGQFCHRGKGTDGCRGGGRPGRDGPYCRNARDRPCDKDTS